MIKEQIIKELELMDNRLLKDGDFSIAFIIRIAIITILADDVDTVGQPLSWIPEQFIQIQILKDEKKKAYIEGRRYELDGIMAKPEDVSGKTSASESWPDGIE